MGDLTTFLTHTNQLLLVTFCDTIAGFGIIAGPDLRKGRKDMKVEVVI